MAKLRILDAHEYRTLQSLVEVMLPKTDAIPVAAGTQDWTYPSRANCTTCHNAAAGFVLGVRTNLDHLQDVLAVPAFLAGDLTTAFLDEHMADWPGDSEIPDLAQASVAVAERFGAGRAAASEAGGAIRRYDPWDGRGGFRVAAEDTP